ncbi:MAG TPA: DUF2894 domain-containing protein [Polyangiales bacterium]|nr:DUF2894 domain-containing protein [Polyangiales bacterium]
MTQAELTGIERALCELEARGGRAFDRAECQCVRELLGRAKALNPRAAALLLPRVRERLSHLTERFDTQRAQASERLSAAEQVHGVLPQLQAAFERSDLSRVRRALRRLRSTPARRRRNDRERCANLYETALGELAGSFTVAQAVDTVPEHSGPYNSLRIATELLACISAVSPIYLTAQLSRLEDLGRMLTLPGPPEPPRPSKPPSSKPPPRKSARPAKRRS